MRCLGRIIALFLLSLVIISLPFAIWMLSFWEIGTNPEKVNRIVDEPVYDRLAPLTIPYYAQSIQNRQKNNEIDVFVAVIDNIDTQNWEEMSDEIISAEWLEGESKSNFTNGLSFLNGDTDVLSLVVDVEPVRSNLIEGGAEQLVDNMMAEVEDFESCTADEETDLEEFLKGSGLAYSMPDCKPSQALLGNIRLKLEQALFIIVESLPEDDQWVFHEEIVASGDLSEADLRLGAKVTRHDFQMAENTMGINFLIPIMLMGLIIFFAVRTAKEFFFWVGLALMTSGLLNVLPVMGLLSSGNNALEAIPQQTTDELWVGVGLELVNSLSREISGPIIGSTFIMVFFGFVSLVLATMLRSPEEEKQEFFYMPEGGSTPIPMPGVPVGSTPTPYPIGTNVATPPPVAIPTPPPTPSETMPDERTLTTPPPIERDKSSQIQTDISEKLPDPVKPEGFIDDRTYIPQNDLTWDESEATDSGDGSE